MHFQLFDPHDEVLITQGCHLPHWSQAGATYFITFRTEDSIPADVAKQWYRSREDWLRRHAVNPSDPDWQSSLEALPRQTQREFHRTFSQDFLAYLDRGYGACVLRQAVLSSIVADCLRHFDGTRYHLGDFVVMPNHVHLLVCLLGETTVKAQCYSWKKFSATRINRALGQKGRFWQEDSFDHLVRSPEQFESLRRYIADNPGQASLREGEYLYWKRP